MLEKMKEVRALPPFLLSWNHSLILFSAGVRFVGTADSRCGKRLVMLDRPDVEINWEPFSRWIEQNETSAPSPAISELSVPTRFRVIDIGKKCVIKASSSCRYAALSYVWGNVKTSLQASTSNIESLGVSGSLSDIENPLAAVISDAITACEHLKIDYLWVDQLCILQDITLEEKTPHLNAMGAIYNHACVTLVALAGADANYGLPGVGGRQRIPRWKGKLQGLYLLNEVDGHGAVLRQSKWATRGWTFQEAMLSQRMLLFSDMGLVFEPYYGVPQYEDWGNYADWGSANIPLKNYEEQVKQFTRRDFSKESDILQAFAGLLSATCEEGHYYGLPLDHFDDSLFWYTTDKSYQARTAPDHDDIFPSWAWSSITGPIDFLRSDMKSGLLAMWAIPSSSDGENNLKVIPNSVESQQRGSYQDEFMMTHAWRRGCFPEKIPAALDKDGLSWDEYLEAREGKWSSLGEICHFAQGIDRQNTSISDAETKFPAHLQRKCGPGCLLVYTQSLRVKIIRAQDDRYFKLQDNQGVIVAWLLESTYKWDLISNACSDETADLFDLIALFTHWHRDSDESDPHVNGGAYGEECRSGWPSVISTERPLEPEMLKVILMLVKTEHGISKRVGLARAWLPVWCDVKPQFNTFILS